MTEVHVIDLNALEAEGQGESQLVDSNGHPVRTQQEGQPCVNEGCGAAGAFVKPVIGGGCVCMRCGCEK